ncbi:AraC family transcriptional regulator ligand-binding domain-containing protein [Streptomyces sp. NPDC060194]|uniref:AraC family transcriptional regulator n=1 Tax=Streptomyces sp. NPDC060194 TaxID=3347069 RepID=UPI003652CF9C
MPGTTPTAFARVNVQAAQRAGVRPDQYAGLLGLAPEHLSDDRYRIPASSNVRLWELMTLHAPWQDVASHMVQQSALGALGIWDYLVTQAATPLEGLHDGARFLATAADAGTETLEIRETGGRITISHVNAADLTDHVASAIRAYSMALLARRVSEASRRNVVPVGVVLAAKAPRSHGTLNRLYGTPAIEFAGPVNSITFRSDDLKAAQPHAPGLSALLRRHAEQSLRESVPLGGWIDTFRATLRGASDNDVPSLSHVAHRMCLSGRTLQRRLEENGTTWSDELQTLRRGQTLDLLTRTEMPFDAVARRAGFADVSGLRRAVQRWTGQSLSAVRRRDGASGPLVPSHH